MAEYIPPWSTPYVIGIAGLSGSGKTTVAQEIISSINEPWTVLLSLDNFYQPLTKEQSLAAFDNNHDFDHPSSVDLDLVVECVRSLKSGKRTDIPVYSFVKHDREPDQKITIYGANVIIIEGIFALFKPELLELMDCKIYVDTDLDICYSRRLLRDNVHRGRSIKGVISQWDRFVKPNAISYVIPTRNNADMVIPRGTDNRIAMELLIAHLRKQLELKSEAHVKHLKSLGAGNTDWGKVHVLNETNQLKCLKTMIIDTNTTYDDFIFSFDRVASMLILEALNYVEYQYDKTITTPVGTVLENCTYAKQETNAVSIIRSGDCFTSALRKTTPAAKIGKLLIQTDSRTGEPKLHTEKLQSFDTNENVLLFDAQSISGGAAIMAIKVLLDHNVSQDKIILVNFTASETALTRILHAFPHIKVVTAIIGHKGNSTHNLPGDSDDEWWMSTRFIDNKYYGTS